MTCVSPDARITPGCLGLWNDAASERNGSASSISFMADRRRQGRHAARPRRAQGLDQGRLGRHRSAARDGGWPLISASALPVSPEWASPARDDARRHGSGQRRLRRARRDAASGAASTGSNCIARTAICCRASFRRSTNLRDDEYGGDHENRARYPLEVFRAMRAVWPADRPMSVRLSCHDWTDGRQHARRRRDLRPRCSRTPAPTSSTARRVRCRKPSSRSTAACSRRRSPTRSATRSQSPTIAVGAISEADHANSIMAAGRADLCAIARPHLADPAWTLHEAAKIGVADIGLAQAVSRRQGAVRGAI